MKHPAAAWAVTAIALLAVALAAGLEGATETRFGAVALVVGGVAGVVALAAGELPAPGPLARRAMWVLASVLILQAVPMPSAVRAVLSPGVTERLDVLAGTPTVTVDSWLTALSRFDVALLLGEPATLDFDPLQGSVAEGLRPLWLSPSAGAWQVGTWAAYALLVVAGWRVGRDSPTLRVFLLGFVGIAVFEALFGLANRNGNSTGIGTKIAYLGSSTGTFINRGHYAAFLVLGIGCLWGLAAALFPLLPEEVRRHRERKRRSSQPPGLLEASGDKVPRLILITFVTALCLVAVVASNSRGALVSFVLAGLAVGGWVWWRREDNVHIGLGVGAPLAGLVLSTLALGPRGAFSRFAAIGTNDVSLTSRVDLWRASISAFLDAPVLGAGAGSWSLAFAPHELGPHLYDVSHAHNEALELLVELGAVGFVALLVLVGSFLRAVARRIDVVEPDFHTAAGIGSLVALTAIALQSTLDFPSRTPGVGVAFALFTGIVLACFDATQLTRRRWPLLALAAVALITLVPAGIADHRQGGSRLVRRSEAAPAALLARGDTPEAARAIAADACARADWEAFDAWQHAACAIAASRAAAATGDAEQAFTADLAAVRALRLRPRDPRLQLQIAQAWMRLGEPTLLGNAFAERATTLLTSCVGLDGWRAESAFELARKLPEGAVDRLGAAASDEAVSRSRTLYQYGIVLDERGRKPEALAALTEAAHLDPKYGPPAFRAGLVARQQGDQAAARAWFEGFLAARDRPTGMEGWSLLYLDQPDAAEVRFRRAVADNPANRWAIEGLAAVAAAREDTAAECEAWRRVLTLTPDHPQASARLAAIGC